MTLGSTWRVKTATLLGRPGADSPDHHTATRATDSITPLHALLPCLGRPWGWGCWHLYHLCKQDSQEGD